MFKMLKPFFETVELILHNAAALTPNRGVQNSH